MLTLTPTLLTAQMRPSREPYISVKVSRQIGNVRRLDWTRIYAGSEPDDHHAAACPGDGSLVRFRLGQNPKALYVNRVPVPAIGEGFDLWTLLEASVSGDAGIAACAFGQEVSVFFVNQANDAILCRTSNNGGQTFGAPSTVSPVAAPPGYLAAAQTATKLTLIYNIGAIVYRVQKTGGSWGTAGAWSNSVASCTGLATFYDGDFDVVVTGTDAGNNARCWTGALGDGYRAAADTWTALEEVIGASAGSGVTYTKPAAIRADVYRLTFVESFAGSQAYARPVWTHAVPGADYLTSLWREPVPFDATSSFGLAWAALASTVYLCSPSGVWIAELVSLAGTDLGTDVVAATIHEDDRGGNAVVQLRNEDGRYAVGGSGFPADLRRGAQVEIGLGYRTEAGLEAVVGPTFWLERFEWEVSGRRSTLTLHGLDGWDLLAGWVARRQIYWSAGSKNIWQILAQVFARAGLELVAGGSTSDELTSWQPAFTIQPGENGRDAARRLLAMVSDEVYFAHGRAYLSQPRASDPSTYTFGLDHPILAGSYQERSPSPNRVQVYGAGAFGEAFNWDEIGQVYDTLLQVRDLNQNTGDRAITLAGTVLERAGRWGREERIRVPVHCGAQLWDAVQVSEPKAGVHDQLRRITGIETHFGRFGRLTYEQEITLGAG